MEAFDFINGQEYSGSGRKKLETYFSISPGESITSKKDILKIFHYEEWESLKQFEDYLKSSSFRRNLELIELSVAEPSFKVFECDSVKGFSWISSLITENKSSDNEIK